MADSATTILDPSILKFVDSVSCITTPYEEGVKNTTPNRVLETCYYLGFETDKDSESEPKSNKSLVLMSGLELSINLRFVRDITARTTNNDLGYEEEEEEEEGEDESANNDPTGDKKRKHLQTESIGEGDDASTMRFRKKRRGPNGITYYVRDTVKEAKFTTLSEFTIKRALTNSFFGSVKKAPWYQDPVVFHHIGADSREHMDHTCELITGISWSGSDDVFVATVWTRSLPFYLFVLRKIGSTVRVAGKPFTINSGTSLQPQSETSALHEQINNVLLSDDKHKRRIVTEIILNHYALLEKGKNAYTIKYSNTACTKDLARYENMFSGHECNARLVTRVTVRWASDNKHSEVEDDYGHYFTSNLMSTHTKTIKAVGDSLLKHVPDYCSWDLTNPECVKPIAKFAVYAISHKHITFVKHLGSNMNDKTFSALRKTRTTLDKTKNKLADLCNKLRKTEDEESREMIEAEIKLVGAEKKALQIKTHQSKIERTGVNSKAYTYQDRQRLATRIKELEASLANTEGEKDPQDVKKLADLREELAIAEKGGAKKKNNTTISQFFVTKK